MGILAWLVFGLIAGAIAGFISKSSFGIIGDIIVGIVGAFIGGFLGSTLLGVGVDGFNIQSFVVAVIGALLLIGLLRVFSSRRAAL